MGRGPGPGRGLGTGALRAGLSGVSPPGTSPRSRGCGSPPSAPLRGGLAGHGHRAELALCGDVGPHRQHRRAPAAEPGELPRAPPPSLKVLHLLPGEGARSCRFSTERVERGQGSMGHLVTQPGFPGTAAARTGGGGAPSRNSLCPSCVVGVLFWFFSADENFFQFNVVFIVGFKGVTCSEVPGPGVI